MNDLPAGIVCASGVLKGSVDVFSEITGSGLELASAAADPGAGHGDAEAAVVCLAQPSEFFGRSVRFVAVLVVDHQEPPRSA
jgi:hypothetical protein